MKRKAWVCFCLCLAAFLPAYAQDADMRFKAALDALRSRDYSLAEDLLREMILEKPADGEINYQLGYLYGRQGKYQQAYPYLVKAVDELAGSQGSGNQEEAVFAALLQRGRCEYGMKNFAAAEKSLQPAVDYAESGSGKARAQDCPALDLGHIYLMQRKDAEAKQYYALSDACPLDPQAGQWLKKAYSAVFNGEINRLAFYYFTLAVSLREFPAEAAKKIERAVYFTPDFVAFQDAADVLRQELKTRADQLPQPKAEKYSLAEQSRETTRTEKSMSGFPYKSGVENSSVYSRIMNSFALLRPEDAEFRRKAGRAREIMAAYKKAYDYLMKKEFRRAEIVLNRLLINAPDFSNIHNLMGVFLASQGHFAKAREMFIKELQIQPDNAEAAFNLAAAYFEGGEFDQALVLFEKLLELNPQDQRAEKYIRLIRQFREDQPLAEAAAGE